MKRTQRLLAVATTAGFIVATVSVSSATAGGSATADSGGYVRIPDSAYVVAPPARDLGNFPHDKVRYELSLATRNTAQAQALAYAVSDPSSPQYGHFLSPSTYRALFATTDAQARTVTNFLTKAGMHITYNPDNHLIITAEGTVAQAEKAFKTTIDRIDDGVGDIFTTNVTDLFVPANTVNVIDSFIEGGAHPSPLAQPQHHSGDLSRGSTKARTSVHADASSTPTVAAGAPPDAGFANATPCSAYWAEKTSNLAPLDPTKFFPAQYAPCGYKPAQLQGAYGTDKVYNQGVTGAGVTVTIVDAFASPTIGKDIKQYAANNGGAPWGNKFTNIVPANERYGYHDTVNGDLCGEQGWYGEETLDVEAVHTMAPQARVTYVGAESCLDQDLLAAENDIVDGHLADIVSNSWGGNGEAVDPGLLDVYNAVFVQAALEGIGTFFSSGDDGDEVDDIGARQADFPASDPWVTAVGGTSLGVGASNNYLFETGWGTTRSTLTTTTPAAWTPTPPDGLHLYGAGGGTSLMFAQPKYQKGVVPDALSQYFGKQRARVVPDIAALADPTTGMLVGQTQTFAAADGGVRYGEYRIGGTSLASPLMAGIEALADQAKGRNHGFANPAIYQLQANAVRDVVNPAKIYSAVREDYAAGSASGPATPTLRVFNQTESIKTRPGYDDVTGVGTPNGKAYVFGLGH